MIAAAEPAKIVMPRSDPRLEMIEPLEAAAGWVFGQEDLGIVASHRGTAGDALDALERAIASARGEAPCYVAFSGGRDSSAVLAVAVRDARRRGLPDPVPITDVYPNVAESDESSWQETVIRHLRLRDWIRRTATDDSDLLGTCALRLLRRYGPAWPPTIHGSVGLFTAAAGGVLMTGEGGDNVFGDQRITALRRVAQRRRPSTRDASSILHAVAPNAFRRRATEREVMDSLPWLQPDARREVALRLGRDVAATPLHWYRAMTRGMGARSARVGLHNAGIVAGDAGTMLVHPLRDISFLASLSPITGRWGFANRGALMEALFAELLPREILVRKSKAWFNGAFFGEASRAFAEAWDGSGVDPALVDVEALRREWAEPEVHAMALPLVQIAWIANNPAPMSVGGP